MLGHAARTTARLQQRSLPIRNVSKLMLLAANVSFGRRLYLAALGKLLHNPVNLIRVIPQRNTTTSKLLGLASILLVQIMEGLGGHIIHPVAKAVKPFKLSF